MAPLLWLVPTQSSGDSHLQPLRTLVTSEPVESMRYLRRRKELALRVICLYVRSAGHSNPLPCWFRAARRISLNMLNYQFQNEVE